MEIEVSIGSDSLSLPVKNPHRLDIEEIMHAIEGFACSKGGSLTGLDVRGIMSAMVRGIAGCERGCPADALGVVRRGYEDFRLAYVEGGILTANATMRDGRDLAIKVFPDF